MTGEGGQSPGQGEGGAGQNPAQGAGGVKMVKIGDVEVPQDALNVFMQDRINEVKDTERGKYKDYPDLKKAAAELAEIKKGQLSEIDRLKGDNAEKDKKIADLENAIKGHNLEKIKLQKLSAASIGPDWADSVFGDTEEEVQKSVERLAVRLKIQPPPTVGTGSNPANAAGDSSSKAKIWTEAEIKELRVSGKLTDQIMAEIKQAHAEGRVQ